jgi:hypothetical protein
VAIVADQSPAGGRLTIDGTPKRLDLSKGERHE